MTRTEWNQEWNQTRGEPCLPSACLFQEYHWLKHLAFDRVRTANNLFHNRKANGLICEYQPIVEASGLFDAADLVQRKYFALLEEERLMAERQILKSEALAIALS